MGLWRVDINQLAHRFVEADSAASAEAMVTQALLAGLDLSVTPATDVLARAYEEAGPTQRRRFLASLDGLAHPMRRQASATRATRRNLARLILHDVSTSQWVRQYLENAPPIPHPERIDRLLRVGELHQMEQNFNRLRDDEANSPFHS